MKRYQVQVQGQLLKKIVAADNSRFAAERVMGCTCWPFQDQGRVQTYTLPHSNALVIVTRCLPGE